MPEAKQAQRFILVDGKRFAVEQVQTVTVVDPSTLNDCLETAYHICKEGSKPVLPTVQKKLVDIAAKDCGTYVEGARVLGTSYRTFRENLHSDSPPKYTRLGKLLNE